MEEPWVPDFDQLLRRANQTAVQKATQPTSMLPEHEEEGTFVETSFLPPESVQFPPPQLTAEQLDNFNKQCLQRKSFPVIQSKVSFSPLQGFYFKDDQHCMTSIPITQVRGHGIRVPEIFFC
jgi:hypothetical protein